MQTTELKSIDLAELIPRAHRYAKDKGFWDVTPNAGQQLMLAISELSEALEAHRKDKWAKPRMESYNREVAYANGRTDRPAEWLANRLQHLFATDVKDTVEDEMADTYIRLCDFAGGFNVDAATLLKAVEERRTYLHPSALPENLGECLLEISDYIVMARCADDHRNAIRSKSLAGALVRIEVLCAREDIDLATHINLKLDYNASRERLHGKNY